MKMGWDGIFSNNNCTWADPRILLRPKNWGGGLVLVSGEEDRVVGVPAEGTVAASVRSVVNVVGTRVGCGSVVRIAASGLSIPGLGIIGIWGVRGALVAVLVLGGPGLPGQPRGHPVDWEAGHSLELDVLQGDHQEPGSAGTDSHKGSKNQDLHLWVAVCKSPC